MTSILFTPAQNDSSITLPFPVETGVQVDRTVVATFEQVTFEADVKWGQDLPLTLIWNFGDGYFGTGLIVSHAYDRLGVYTVTLSVTDSRKIVRITKPLSIVVKVRR
ncbi:MAG: PKD domain-containing protein [Methanomicrobiales archaeon]|nr:PKD domain-containing protein [Methanomicrobiales archaeon]